ncbi:hypothetical protein C0J52_07997 [Blattella germanica]|nr:hypothetical protein C0J52_07997 [Blattella germanica]
MFSVFNLSHVGATCECENLWRGNLNKNRLQEEKLRVAELDFFRKSARKMRLDRNTQIRCLMNIKKDVLEEINEGRLQWFRSISRMEDGRLLKEVMEWTLEGRNRKGRPTGKWMELDDLWS